MLFTLTTVPLYPGQCSPVPGEARAQGHGSWTFCRREFHRRHRRGRSRSLGTGTAHPRARHPLHCASMLWPLQRCQMCCHCGTSTQAMLPGAGTDVRRHRVRWGLCFISLTPPGRPRASLLPHARWPPTPVPAPKPGWGQHLLEEKAPLPPSSQTYPKTWGSTLSSLRPSPGPPPLLGLRVGSGHVPWQGPAAQGAQQEPGV